MEQIKSITEKTLVPLSLAMTMMGGMAWLTGMYSKITELSNTQIQVSENMKTIDQRLSRIEGVLSVKIGAENEYDDDDQEAEVPAKSFTAVHAIVRQPMCSLKRRVAAIPGI